MEGSWQNHLCQVFDRPRKHPTPRVERVWDFRSFDPPGTSHPAEGGTSGGTGMLLWEVDDLEGVASSPQKFLAGNWRFRKKKQLSPVSPVVTKHILKNII